MNHLVWQYGARWAESTPDALAVQDRNATLTYAELAEEADLGAGFLAELGIRRGDRVAVLLPKSMDAVVATQAVSRLGAIYVPVDHSAPAARTSFILDNCRVAGVITTKAAWEKLLPLFEGTPPTPVLLDGDASLPRWQDRGDAVPRRGASGVHDHSPAYILYTSGSTGRPKGVVISHRNARAFVDWGVDEFGLDAADRLSNHAPFHFDLSVFDLYAAWAVGASVHLVGPALAPFPGALARWIAEREITTWYSVPSALVRLLLRGGLDEREYPALRQVLYAGEVFPVRHLRRVMEVLGGASFHNLYGPTETNVITHHTVPRPLADDVSAIPIGKACPFAELFVEKDDGNPAEPGEIGELVAGGATVMLGYWANPDASSKALAQAPSVSDYRSIVYRTGDLVRLAEDGETIFFLGRRDHQVKTRGYRVELGDVERAILAHEDVLEAAVSAEADEEVGHVLLGFVVAREGTALSVGQLKTHCEQLLPRYAVPERWEFRADLPKTSTGKIDRMALSGPTT